jgi:hypothetical protein
MTDAPKRRGRPPKVIVGAREAAAMADDAPFPTSAMRIKAEALGMHTLQQAWRHATGTQWRPLPVVPADAPDWEDA